MVLRQPRIDELASKLVQKEGSDLHLKVGTPPAVRVHGLLEYLEGYEVLQPVDTEGLARGIMSEKLLEEFEEHGEADFSYAVGGVGRFRVNTFRQRGSVSIAMRFIPFGVPKFEDLGLPEVVGTLAREERGIILVTGTTGSGKSTTLASMIDLVNRSMPKHIVTIEDPIEFLHEDDRSIINQREVGTDTASYARALKRILRQDPDVILIGEIRDSESARIALSAAETGHLVLSTLHTLDATETINRMIDLFPPHERMQVRAISPGHSRESSGNASSGPRAAKEGSRPARSWSPPGASRTSSRTPTRPARSRLPSPRASTMGCRPSTKPS